MTDGRHALAEEASLALHAIVAQRIRADAAVLDRARRRVDEWLRDGSVARVYADAWREVLSRPIDDVARLLEDRGERARQLRQTSPFAGAIAPRTRWEVWRRYRGGAKAK
jgi:hypothetical protein